MRKRHSSGDIILWGMILMLIGSMIGIDPVMAQSGFDPAAYQFYLKQCQNLSGEDLQQQFKPTSPLYNSTDDTSLARYLFLDSVDHYYRLTQAEQEILKRHHFVVTERCNHDDFGSMLHEIYGRDLPVFVSTDMVLNALHLNFDQIMMSVEIHALEPWLRESLNGFRSAFPALYDRYRSEDGLSLPLQD
ncbi:MAG: DUF3160 domain-containing protein, partial [Candidatus Delongbacteria bacterium]|nr:DUF3160 domain-containing protein [Candidatus Delongbacteria bacterium]